MVSEFQPYVGPRPFERKDCSLFFGRDRETRDLKSLVIAHQAVLLYAQSGAGKTSILNAGLIPALEKERFEILPLARVRGLTPENLQIKRIPNIYVFNALMCWTEGEVDSRQLAQMSLLSFLKDKEHSTDDEGMSSFRIVIFDQFEELFVLYPDRWKEREAFFHQVAEALDDDHLLRVLFVLREDYLACLDSCVDLLPERLRIRYRLERLRSHAACEAVEGPLQETERSFAPGVASGLVRQLLNIRIESAPGETGEAIGEYVEPVQLQIACQSLWVNLPREVTVITSDHLQEFGDVEEALEDFYEGAIDKTIKETGVEEHDLRDWFNDKIITPAGTRGTVFRGKKYTEGIPNSAMEVLQDQHIIRAEMRAGAHWYELTHDRLIEPIRKANEVWYQRRRAEEQQRQVEVERQRAKEHQWRAEEQTAIARRFRRLTILLVITVVAAVAFAVVAVIQRKRAVDAERLAEREKQNAENAASKAIEERERAEAAEKEAESQEKIREDALRFMEFDFLGSIDPERRASRDVSIRSILDSASKNLGNRFRDDPLIEARLRRTFGLMYLDLGAYGVAEENLDRTLQIYQDKLGKEHWDTLGSMNNLGLVYIEQSRYSDAESLFTEAYKIGRSKLEKKDPWLLNFMINLAKVRIGQEQYEEAEKLYNEALELSERTQSEESSSTPQIMNSLARLYATCPIPEIRNNEKAVTYATSACEATDWNNPRYISTFILAHVAMGDLGSAVEQLQSTEKLNLNLSDSAITDTDLAHVGRLNSLRSLSLRRTQVSDAGLIHLKDLISLEDLYLGDTKITDAGLVYLKDLTGLQSLCAHGTEIGDAGLSHLENLNALQELCLMDNTRVTDAGLEHIKNLTSLRRLYLDRTQVTGASLVHLASLGFLESLSLTGSQVTDQGLEYLKKLSSLKYLYLDETQVTDAGLWHLKNLESLRRLYLDGTLVTDAGLEHFESLNALELLSVRRTRVTEGGVGKLRRILPNCRIVGPQSSVVD